MLMKSVFVLFLVWQTSKVNAACQAYTPTTNLTLCSQKYVSINNPLANTEKPLCFMTDSFIHGSNQADWPCMTVTGASGSGRHIEVLVELAQDGTICVKSDAAGDQEQCTVGRQASFCSTVPGGADTLNYNIYCSGNNCEVDQKFWYRIDLEQANPETGDYYENWCATRDTSFPSSLSKLPPSVVTAPPPVSTTEKGAAGCVHSNKFATVLLVSAVLMLISSMMIF